MPGVKTNESPAKARKTGQRGPADQTTHAYAYYVRSGAWKVRVVLDLIRGHDVAEAANILRLCERDAAFDVAKVLHSAVANASHNDGIPAEELYVAACFADEGPTIKRFRPRARGRTGQILKRTSHITIVVGRLPDALLTQARNQSAEVAANRARRTAGARATAEGSAADARRSAAGAEEVIAGATMAAADVVEAVPVAEAAPLAEVQGLVGSTESAAPAEKANLADDPNALNLIIGIGPKLHEELNAAGIFTFQQLADLTDDEITALDAKVSRSADQITDWRQQAQEILAGTWDRDTKNNS
jgi:large subunit ribosomal protein L22